MLLVGLFVLLAWSASALALQGRPAGRMPGAREVGATLARSAVTARAAAGPPAAAPAAALSPAVAPPPDPGSLPQTQQLPAASGTAFDLGTAGLWAAIVTDQPQLAMPFFFPLEAYIQVKAISDAVGDWQRRLVADYVSDIRADHDLLGPDPAAARFAGLDVPEADAEWIVPGVEYNKGTYYRVYGARIDYTIDGSPGSIPVASMISWRGEWYVVHLASIR